MNMERLSRFVRQAKGVPIHALNDAAERDKNDWLEDGRRILREFLNELREGGRISINYAGTAVSGDVILNGDHFYVNFTQAALGPNTGFMYRSCQGRKDYVGGMNRWLQWDDLLTPEKCLECFRAAIQESKTLAAKPAAGV